MPEHMVQGLSVGNVDSISTANLFYFMGDGLYESRKEVIESGINLATWQIMLNNKVIVVTGGNGLIGKEIVSQN